jgi:hypothetical protein
MTASILLVVTSGCGGDDDSNGDDAGTVTGDAGMPRIELGGGQANFEPMGASTELVMGPQGGWHFFVSCRLYALTVEGMHLTYRIERDGAVISMPNERVLQERRLLRVGDHFERVGDLAIFDITAPSEVVGDTVTVFVTGDPVDGDPVSDSRTTTVVDEEP